MRLFSLLIAILAFGFSIATTDAEAAKRLGGGQSSGMQRQATPNQSPSAAPSQAGKPAAAPQAAPKRSWMGPLAGLAAGLGLAALASHLGFGEGLANIMMFALLAMAVVMIVGFVMRRRAMAKQAAGGSGLQYAGAGAQDGLAGRKPFEVAMPGSSSAAPVPALTNDAAQGDARPGNIPADFDKAGFERNAKVNFIRLQAANDAGDVEDIRNFTTPEMFAEVRMQITDRAGAKQKTDVVSINATVFDVAEEESRYVVSVRFTGVIREDSEPSAEGVDEVWHMVKPRDGKSGWMLAGIQQTQQT